MSARNRLAAVDYTELVEGPWNLPEGWEWQRLGEVLPLAYGKALPERARDQSGAVPVYGSSGIVGTHSKALTDGPVILVGRKGSAGAIHYAPEPCWPIDTAYYVLPRKDIDIRYGYYLLQHLRLNQLDQSTAIPSLSRDVYSDVPVPIPSKEVQRRVAVRIDNLFAEIEEGESALADVHAELDTYRKSLLNAAVTGELTADQRDLAPIASGKNLRNHILAQRRKQWADDHKGSKKRYSEPVAPNVDDLPSIPDSWCWLSIDELRSPEIGSISDGPFGSNLKSEHYRETGPRVIRLGNIGREGEFVDLKSHIDQAHFQSLGRHHIGPGDLAVAILGDPLPRAVVIPSNFGPALVKADCIKVRLSNRLHVPLVWSWLNSPTAHAFAKSSIKGIGRPRLSMDHIRSMPVPIPPSGEAKLIVQRISIAMSAVENLRALLGEQSVKMKTLRQSILSSAFMGKLA